MAFSRAIPMMFACMQLSLNEGRVSLLSVVTLVHLCPGSTEGRWKTLVGFSEQ